MFNTLKSLFKSDREENATPSPAFAACVLMVQSALADGKFTDLEREKIIMILKEGFSLDDKDAYTFLHRAEAEAEKAIDHHEFTRVLKTLDKPQRLNIMVHLWMVVLSDGHRDDHEDSLLRRLAPLLALSDRERAQARQTANELFGRN